ncbi:DedA family protein [Mangrovitalea sediminis]|uniref:DedA family protein n=1 Tax=Mangrovitalea sediminis TaxID=1982043 RepID=UPI000BE56BA5|nr:DedA family protein [Mangrovitalea sediminis]
MDLSYLIQQYGYYALFLGTVLEGETVLLLAGLAVSRGYMDFSLAALIAAAGGTLGDQVFFSIGRRYGNNILDRFPNVAERAPRVRQMIDRWHAAVIVLLRFTYGLRTVGPMVVGMSDLSHLRFLFWNALGAIIWATLFLFLGFQFGQALAWLLQDIKRIEAAIFGGIVVLSLTAYLIYRWRLYQRYKHPEQNRQASQEKE